MAQIIDLIIFTFSSYCVSISLSELASKFALTYDLKIIFLSLKSCLKDILPFITGDVPLRIFYLHSCVTGWLYFCFQFLLFFTYYFSNLALSYLILELLKYHSVFFKKNLISAQDTWSSLSISTLSKRHWNS